MHASPTTEPHDLTDRQAGVLRAMVAAWIADAAPVGSRTLSHLLTEPLSPASIRNTLAELAELQLVEKPHASAGRVPSDLGLRCFVEQLLQPRDLGDYERRGLRDSIEDAPAGGAVEAATELLSSHTRQLGIAVVPRLERIVLRHLSLVRLSRERVLAVLVSGTGETYRRVIDDAGADDQAELDGIAASLTELAAGLTLRDARTRLERESANLRQRVGRALERALRLGVAAMMDPDSDRSELRVATRLALFDQPEFRDPQRVRQLLEALETREQLVAVLDQMLEAGEGVAIGSEAEEPLLRSFALVTAPFGPEEAPVGLVGVLGPSRMDYARVIPLVGYLSELVTDRYGA